MSRKKKRTVNQAEIKRMKKLRNTGMPIEKIAEIMGRELRTVRKYLAIEDIEIKRQRQLTNLHVRELTDQLNSLRLCLEHPGIELAVDRGLLTFRGYDWRLDPVRWFCLSTPDIESDDWNPYLEQLRSHTTEWVFWKHWEELRNASMALAYEIRRIGREIAEKDADFKAAWDKVTNDVFHYENGSYYRPSRTSLNPEPSISDIIQTLDDDTIEYLHDKIQDSYQETLWQKQAELEDMLDQLTIDFSDNRLDRWIVEGRCEGCPK